jgi:adenine/guanine phosphoribosyltransferase-like PRPP-binding protein
MKEASELIARFPEEPLKILQELGGFYQCPTNAAGQRLGPLVGYAGKDGQGRQFVGDIYANFAKAEEWPKVLQHFATLLGFRCPVFSEVDVFCGAPMGGLAFATVLSLVYGHRYTFMEKKIAAVASETSREKSNLELSRHEILSGERVIIVEDVTNNFSTTGIMCQLINQAGGIPIAIVSMLNRSNPTLTEFSFVSASIPVVSLVTQPIAQYQQDDPAVAADIQAGNVVWKPKNDWGRLMAAMANHT